MRYENSVAGSQLTILLEELESPTNERERDEFLDDLEAAIEAVLTDHDLDAEQPRAIGGHAYSAIYDDCPECGNRLTLIEPSLDPYNGAHAQARCDCGFYGEAVYRLIDIQDHTSGSGWDAILTTDESGNTVFDGNSSVYLHDIEPRYYPY